MLQGISGGEGGIRTLDGLLTHTHFPGVLLKPLGHLSVISNHLAGHPWRNFLRQAKHRSGLPVRPFVRLRLSTGQTIQTYPLGHLSRYSNTETGQGAKGYLK